MTLPVRKGYKGAPAQAVLTNNPGSNTITDVTFIVDTVVGWATTFPFYCVVDPGKSTEEKVKVTAISGVTLTVVRAQDNTSSFSHNAGAAIYPVFTADEADEANQIASTMTTKGDLIATDGLTFNRLGVGTNTHVLQADSASTNGFKWGQVVAGGIATGAVTSDKILDGTIVLGDLAAALVTYLVPVGTINAYAGGTAPDGWLLCNGTSTTGYTALAALVGATTPDFQGHVLVGKGSAPFNGDLLTKFGSTTSTAAHSHSIDHDHSSQSTSNQSSDHTHAQRVGLIAYADGDNQAVVTQQIGSSSGPDPAYPTGLNSNAHSHPVDINAFTGTSGASSAAATHGNVQPSAIVNYIIKY